MGTVQRRFCPHCDRLVNSVKDGYVTQDQRQRYRCKVCNRTWTDERRKPNLKKETPEERKSYQAQILRAAGVSDKKITRLLPGVRFHGEEKGPNKINPKTRVLHCERPTALELINRHSTLQFENSKIEMVIVVTENDTFVATPKRPREKRKKSYFSMDDYEAGPLPREAEDATFVLQIDYLRKKEEDE